MKTKERVNLIMKHITTDLGYMSSKQVLEHLKLDPKYSAVLSVGSILNVLSYAGFFLKKEVPAKAGSAAMRVLYKRSVRVPQPKMILIS